MSVKLTDKQNSLLHSFYSRIHAAKLTMDLEQKVIQDFVSQNPFVLSHAAKAQEAKAVFENLTSALDTIKDQIRSDAGEPEGTYNHVDDELVQVG